MCELRRVIELSSSTIGDAGGAITSRAAADSLRPRRTHQMPDTPAISSITSHLVNRLYYFGAVKR